MGFRGWVRAGCLATGLSVVFVAVLFGVDPVGGFGQDRRRGKHLHVCNKCGDKVYLTKREPQGVKCEVEGCPGFSKPSG